MLDIASYENRCFIQWLLMNHYICVDLFLENQPHLTNIFSFDILMSHWKIEHRCQNATPSKYIYKYLPSNISRPFFNKGTYFKSLHYTILYMYVNWYVFFICLYLFTSRHQFLFIIDLQTIKLHRMVSWNGMTVVMINSWRNGHFILTRLSWLWGDRADK